MFHQALMVKKKEFCGYSFIHYAFSAVLLAHRLRLSKVVDN